MTPFIQPLVFDVEATSLDFREAEVIEFAAAVYHSDQWNMVHDQMYRPHEPISTMVSSITHITNRMVEECDHFDSPPVQEELNRQMSLGDVHVAHNIFYDENVLKSYGFEFPRGVCTMKMAKRLYPDLESYKLGYLRYHFDLPVPEDLVPHRARADVLVTALLFERLLADVIKAGHLEDNETLPDQLLAWMASPIVMTRMPFGKHKGKLLEDVPLSYWQWALENMDSLQEDKPEYDPDFAESVRVALEKVVGDI